MEEGKEAGRVRERSGPPSANSWICTWVWMCELGVIIISRTVEDKLVLSANRKSYKPRRLAQQRMTLSDLEWPHAISCYLCGS